MCTRSIRKGRRLKISYATVACGAMSVLATMEESEMEMEGARTRYP